MKSIAMGLACLLFLSNHAANPSSFVQAQEMDAVYSFENDFEGWQIRTTGAAPQSDVPPPVTRSRERATHGRTSLGMIENHGFPSQIVWIEKAYTVEAYQSYDIIVDYDFASKDCCGDNSLRLLTGVARRSPDATKREELISAEQESTYAAENTFGEYKWYRKKHEFAVHTDEQVKIYVMIGVIASDVDRPYFFDNLHINIRKRAVACEFFSFENDLEGWTPRAIDLLFLNGSLPWSVTRSQQFFQDGGNSAQIEIDNANGRAQVWLEKAIAVEPGRKYRINIEYGFFKQSATGQAILLTGVVRKSPPSAHAMEPNYQEVIEKAGFPWKRRQFQFIVKAKQTSTLYVIIGVFARQNGIHLYNFDNICVSVTPK
jgi:hypothetical protein